MLAFTNMSGDPEQEYFSDGIADDIITELSRSRSLFVIARNSSFTYKGRAVDIKQVAPRTGRALCAGRQRASQRRAACASPRSSSTRRPATISGRNATIAHWKTSSRCRTRSRRRSSTAIVPAVADAEQRRILRKPPENLGAWESVPARPVARGQTDRADNTAGAGVLPAGHSQLDPGFASAYVERGAHLSARDSVYVASMPVEDAAALAIEQARSCARHRSRACGRRTPPSVLALFLLGDTDAAAVLADRAGAVDRSDQFAGRVPSPRARSPDFPGPARGRRARSSLPTCGSIRRDMFSASNRVQLSLSHYFERDYETAADISQAVDCGLSAASACLPDPGSFARSAGPADPKPRPRCTRPTPSSLTCSDLYVRRTPTLDAAAGLRPHR